MGKPVPPSTSAKSFSCPHCGAYAHQSWYEIRARAVRAENELPARYSAGAADHIRRDKNVPDDVRENVARFFERASSGEVFFEGTQDGTYTTEVTNLTVSQCFSCQKLAIWIHERLAYPVERQGDDPNADLPAEVLTDYDEARTIAPLSPRGAAALLRLCIQKLCKHLGESGENVNGDIASLVRKGLPARIQRALDIVRVIGNEAVHPGVLDLKDDRDTATELFQLVNLIAESMISQPKRVDAMYEGLPEDKRKAIEARDKQGRQT